MFTGTINGVGYSLPNTGEDDWGTNVSNWMSAVSQHLLQKTGGSFTLSNDADFGSAKGLLAGYFTSKTANPASAGVLRLAKTDTIGFRNNANGADLAVGINGSDNLTFGGTKLLLSGAVVNADINASAAIVYSKLSLTGSILNADINASAAIAYSKLALTGAILNADLAGSIAYSKLSLTGAILNADLAGSIARSKIASGSANQVLINDGSGNLSSEATLAKSRGGSGQDNSSLTFPASGTLTENAAAQTLTNKTIVAGSNTISGITVAMQSSGAAASGTVATADGAAGVSWVAPSGFTKNFLLNSNFDFWQRSGTAITGIANGSSTYGADRWYAKNSLGTNGVMRIDQTTAVTNGSLFGCQVKISTAPTAAQANGCELYQTIENPASILLYGQTASFSIRVKALNNVNQVGVQFFYKTTEAKVDTAIGSEVLTTVNSSTFTQCSISGQALGTSQTTSGVIGVRIRITAVSSGNTYDINNGFIVEQAMLNIGSAAGSYTRAELSYAAELTACQRFYEKSYDLTVTPGTVIVAGSHDNRAAYSTMNFPISYKVTKRAGGTVTAYSPDTGASGKFRDASAAADIAASVANNVLGGVTIFGGGCTDQNDYRVHWTADAEI